MKTAYFWAPYNPEKHNLVITNHKVRHYGYVGWYDEHWLCKPVHKTWSWWIFSWSWTEFERIREVTTNELISQACLGVPIEIPDCYATN